MPPTPEHADVLQEMIEGGRDSWPLAHEAPVLDQLVEWRAMRESDRDVLRSRHPGGWPASKPYRVDPLPERIAEVFPDLIFGADPKVTTASVAAARATRKLSERAAKEEGVVEDEDEPNPEAPDEGSEDQRLLDEAIDENELPSQLQEAGAICVSEGEVWWRIYVDRDAYDYPVIEWHSRIGVIPLWRGRKAVAAAFVSELDALAPDAPVARVGDDADPATQLAWRQQGSTSQTDAVYRYIEIQTKGMVRNLLYKGDRSKLGDRVALSEREELADIPDEWVHDLDVMLAGRIVNGRSGGRLGRSQFKGIKDLVYMLNEAVDIGGHNAKMTLRRRAVMPASAARAARSGDDEDGNARGLAKVDMDDVFLLHSDDEMDEATGPMKVLEYSFDAAALEIYDNHTTDKALTRARVAPQLVGRATEGAATGPALKARLLDSILCANGMARAWDDGLPKLLLAEQLVMQLPPEQGGHGYKMESADKAPAVERSSALPEDEDAQVTRIAAEVGAEILSKRTAIEERHPDWGEDRIQEELDRIEAEKPTEPVLPGVAPGEGEDTLFGGGLVGAPGTEEPLTGVGADLAEMPEGAVQVFRTGDQLRVRGLPAPEQAA